MRIRELASAVGRPGVAVFLFLALFSVHSRLLAQTMLTNGHPVHLRLPVASPAPRLVNGADGFYIFVPPGATTLTVEFATTRFANVELLVSSDIDVGTINLANDLADFRTFPDGNGVAKIEVSSTKGFLKLKSAIYFVGFMIREGGVSFEGTLQATIDGPVIDLERIVQESEFESGLDGWMHNSEASPIPGTNVGGRASFISHSASGGNPGGFARLRDGHQMGPEEWFVAPPKFLINLLEFPEPRFVFDLVRLAGDSTAHFNVQVRVFGSETVYVWSGRRPATIGIWEHFSVSLRSDLWSREQGEATFADVFGSPERIEVRGSYTFGVGSVGLDNFRVLAKGGVPSLPVLPMISGFSGGLDGWSRNYPEDTRVAGSTVGDKDSLLVWNDPEGNPGGFLRLVDNGGPGGDAFVASADFLGDMSALNIPRIEFDYRHSSMAGPTRPVQVRLIGEDAVFLWTGAVPGEVWAHQVAPLTEVLWTRLSGSAGFLETLANVVRIEISADQADGQEWNSLDNFALLTADSPALPQTLSGNPAQLAFSGVATGANPDPQTIQMSSSGGTLQWRLEATGELADRISFSRTSGETPSAVAVAIDTQGLPSGSYEAELICIAVGVSVNPDVIPLTLDLGPQPHPTPKVSAGAIVNAATFEPNLSPGSLGTIFGEDLTGFSAPIRASFVGRMGDRLPTQLSGIRVLVHTPEGGLIGEAPLLYVSDTQINFQMPFEVFGLPSVSIVVDHSGARSEARSVEIVSASPGIFTFGENRALAVNQDGSLNSSNSQAARGSVLTVYLTGGGVVAPTWPSGRAASAFPLIRTPSQTSVLIGGAPAEIQFMGLAPGFVGVVQLNVRVSSATPPGDQPLQVTVNGVASNEPVVSIQ